TAGLSALRLTGCATDRDVRLHTDGHQHVAAVAVDAADRLRHTPLAIGAAWTRPRLHDATHNTDRSGIGAARAAHQRQLTGDGDAQRVAIVRHRAAGHRGADQLGRARDDARLADPPRYDPGCLPLTTDR